MDGGDIVICGVKLCRIFARKSLGILVALNLLVLLLVGRYLNLTNFVSLVPLLLGAEVIFINIAYLLLQSFVGCSTVCHSGMYVIPPTDAVIGQLLQLGVSRCPELAKAWSQFASWCYRWGRRVVDAASEAGGQLSEADRVAVQHLMPPGMTADDLDKVYFILSQTRAVADEEDIEVRLLDMAGMK
jgi:hypothetical protein